MSRRTAGRTVCLRTSASVGTRAFAWAAVLGAPRRVSNWRSVAPAQRHAWTLERSSPPLPTCGGGGGVTSTPTPCWHAHTQHPSAHHPHPPHQPACRHCCCCCTTRALCRLAPWTVLWGSHSFALNDWVICKYRCPACLPVASSLNPCLHTCPPSASPACPACLPIANRLHFSHPGRSHAVSGVPAAPYVPCESALDAAQALDP